MTAIMGFESKLALVERYAAGRNVLHLGAVGETCQDTELRASRATDSLHAYLTRISTRCIGVDNDEPSVKLLTERGAFDNLLLADVTTLTRREVDLPSVDIIVAGDTIEHLTEPGRLLDVVDNLADPGTRLILTTPNALGLGIFMRNLRGKQVEGPDHVCSFNAFTLSRMIERYTWKVDELWTCYQPKAADLNPRTFRAGKALLTRYPRLGGTLFAACSRPD